MPLFIPILLGGLAVISGVAGAAAAIDANDKFKKAKNIVNTSRNKYSNKKRELEKYREKVYKNLVSLGEYKKKVFEQTGKDIVNIIENSKTSAEIISFEIRNFVQKDIPKIKNDIIQLSAIDISLNASGSISMAALGAAGTYSAVMTFGAASTGTAISTLSGAAATNATLAWLGGGSLATGGLGIVGGTWVLGGLVAGPALAILGFSLSSKSEKAMTEALRYESEVEKAIADMDKVKVILKAINSNIYEVNKILSVLAQRFETTKQMYLSATDEKTKKDKLRSLVMIFKAIKEVVNEPILDEKGAAVIGLKKKLYAKINFENYKNSHKPKKRR